MLRSDDRNCLCGCTYDDIRYNDKRRLLWRKNREPNPRIYRSRLWSYPRNRSDLSRTRPRQDCIWHCWGVPSTPLSRSRCRNFVVRPTALSPTRDSRLILHRHRQFFHVEESSRCTPCESNARSWSLCDQATERHYRSTTPPRLKTINTFRISFFLIFISILKKIT